MTANKKKQLFRPQIFPDLVYQRDTNNELKNSNPVLVKINFTQKPMSVVLLRKFKIM